MKKKLAIIISSFLLILSLYSVGFSNTSPVLANSEEASLLAMINNERQIAGLPSLKWNDKLAQAANAKAKDMIANDYWAHNSPSSKTPWTFITGAKYRYYNAGENLARGYSSLTETVSAWMKSPSHKTNIVSGKYKDTGIAIVSGKMNGVETTLVVQMFGSTSSKFF